MMRKKNYESFNKNVKKRLIKFFIQFIVDCNDFSCCNRLNATKNCSSINFNNCVEYQPKVGIIIIAIIASCGYQAY